MLLHVHMRVGRAGAYHGVLQHVVSAVGACWRNAFWRVLASIACRAGACCSQVTSVRAVTCRAAASACLVGAWRAGLTFSVSARRAVPGTSLIFRKAPAHAGSWRFLRIGFPLGKE